MRELVSIKVVPCRCRLADHDVWAVLSRQEGGAWRMVECRDRDGACAAQPCMLTTEGGQWPLDIDPPW